MKRKIILSIALILSIVLVSLIKSDSTVSAEPPNRFVYDLGLVTLGDGQRLRLTVVSPRDPASGQFRRIEYAQTACSGGICRYTISEQTASPVITLNPNEAFIYELGDTATHEVRAAVVSDSKNLQVNALIIDAATGEVVSLLAKALCNNEVIDRTLTNF